MFHSIKEWAERHPYLLGSLILGVILVWFWLRSRSQAASSSAGATAYTGPSEALQAAELSAGVQTQQAALAAQTQVAGYNAAVNSQQLQSAAAIQEASLASNVTNTQTAAQLQYGLATMGFTPSTSPFGLTMPISGVTPVLPGGTTQPIQTTAVINPSSGTPAPSGVSSTVLPGLTPQNPTVTSSGSQATMNEFANETVASTGAGSGGLVTVPSVPIYGPPDAAGNPSLLGYTGQTVIPSSSGLNWQQYYQSVTATEPAGNETPGGVTADAAAQIAAELDYLNNPNSCHNRVCA